MNGPYQVKDDDPDSVVVGPETLWVYRDALHAAQIASAMNKAFAAGRAAADSEAVRMLEWLFNNFVFNTDPNQVLVFCWNEDNWKDAIRAAMEKEKDDADQT